MKSNSKTTPRSSEQESSQTAFDKMEDMWDKKLASGDDDFYEAFRQRKNATEDKHTRPDRNLRQVKRKRGRF